MHIDSSSREHGADQVTDWINSYTPAEATALATVLAMSAAREKDLAALESQLHAILELTSTGYVQRDHILHLREIDPTELTTELKGYLVDLFDSPPS
ncbi:hypothetical protein [Streptomyces sp. NPDC046821]|uniref:hypothetical protein n=1 Tax=Streptomyces sp. NPDC046821 TaxID=3154702 RepID=UPI0033E22921